MAMGNFIFGWSSSLYGVLFPDYIRLNGLTSTNASTLLMIYGGIGSASRLCFVVLGLYAVLQRVHFTISIHAYLDSITKCVSGQFLNVKSVYAIISGHVILGVGLIGLIFSTDFEQFVLSVLSTPAATLSSAALLLISVPFASLQFRNHDDDTDDWIWFNHGLHQPDNNRDAR